MRWSLSEYLSLVELRGQNWCFADLGATSGFTIPHNQRIFFYAALDGSAKIRGVISGEIDLQPGDVVMILSGEAHAVHLREQGATAAFDFLRDGEYVDTPPTFTMGRKPALCRLLCGSIKIRWPGAQRPRAIPSFLQIRAAENFVDVRALAATAVSEGASSMLVRLATLLFVQAFRQHPQCREIFQQFNIHDPILRARQFIEKHPFTDWSVEALAHKVGMGRSRFAALFVDEIGKTPMQAVTEERMRHAVDFLRNTDLKVGEISGRIGYRSEAAFSRRFKCLCGMTPNQLRRTKPSRVDPDEAHAERP